MTPSTIRDIFFLAPEIVLTVWGLVVLLVDLGLARRLTPAARRRTDRLAVAGRRGARAGRRRGRLFRAAHGARVSPGRRSLAQPGRRSTTSATPIPCIFFGTIAGDVQTAFFNILYVVLLGLIVGLSMAGRSPRSGASISPSCSGRRSA